jgi:hypothetical protein
LDCLKEFRLPVLLYGNEGIGKKTIVDKWLEKNEFKNVFRTSITRQTTYDSLFIKKYPNVNWKEGQ